MKKQVVIRNKADRLRYVIVFELILISILAPLGAYVLDKSLVDVGLLSIVLSVKAMLFGYLYNWCFDRIDARAGRVPTQRSLAGRILHAVGFECGLVMTSLPIVMWWLQMTLFQALVMDIAVTSIVVVYTFIFTYCYDWLFPVSQPEVA